MSRLLIEKKTVTTPSGHCNYGRAQQSWLAQLEAIRQLPQIRID